MLVTYPDVAYLSVCELAADDLDLSTRASPHLGLLLSGVTPLSRVLHQFGGGAMLPNWCNAPNWCMTSRFEAQPIATTLVAECVAALSLPTSSVAWRVLLERFERC